MHRRLLSELYLEPWRLRRLQGKATTAAAHDKTTIASQPGPNVFHMSGQHAACQSISIVIEAHWKKDRAHLDDNPVRIVLDVHCSLHKGLNPDLK